MVCSVKSPIEAAVTADTGNTDTSMSEAKFCFSLQLHFPTFVTPGSVSSPNANVNSDKVGFPASAVFVKGWEGGMICLFETVLWMIEQPALPEFCSHMSINSFYSLMSLFSSFRFEIISYLSTGLYYRPISCGCTLWKGCILSPSVFPDIRVRHNT